MKTSTIFLAAIFLFAACKKETVVTPKTPPATQSPSTSNHSTGTIQGQGSTTTAVDTLPDRAMMKIKLVKDSVNYDETMFIFSHTASAGFDPNEDSPYFEGYGQESLASISADGRDLVINTLPYSPGSPIRLAISSSVNATFSLQVSFENKIPANIDVKIKDNYLKNTVNISNAPYQFNVVKSDTSTYGANRFELILKKH
ncbi:MAG: hypothetical protein ACXVB6_21645 [Mucilaginibacter sp.]